MVKFLNLAVGGITGTLARYVFSGFVYSVFGTDFPYGTLAVNLTGCLIIGFLTTIAESKFLLNANARVLLMIGFCGAYTTFSTLILETDNFVKNGQMAIALMNILTSVIAGFLLFRIGSLLGRLI